MSSKLLWSGLTLIVASPILGTLGLPLVVVGAILMAVGCVLLIIDK